MFNTISNKVNIFCNTQITKQILVVQHLLIFDKVNAYDYPKHSVKFIKAKNLRVIWLN